jgi:predicted GIY-YIG superfamily endonuclease
VRHVYVLRSARYPRRTYIGLAYNVHLRLAQHNSGLCRSTARHRPWNLLVDIRFEYEYLAMAFERYLKSASGTAFMRRHFVPQPPLWID